MNPWRNRLTRAVGRIWSTTRSGSATLPADDAAAYAITGCVLTDVGCVRESNQDAIAFVSPPEAKLRALRGVLAIVADGMGGHNGGAVASTLAVETVCREYYAAASRTPARALEQALSAANAAIFAAAQADVALSGMGTTCTALVLVGSQAWVAHVGDSRLYRCTSGGCEQVTEDHTLVAELVRNGLLQEEQALQHAARSILLASLGTQAGWPVPAQRLAPPRVGECFVLCSDGLWEYLARAEIASAVASGSPDEAARHLIELARERGGRDNISVGIVAIRPPSDS